MKAAIRQEVGKGVETITGQPHYSFCHVPYSHELFATLCHSRRGRAFFCYSQSPKCDRRSTPIGSLCIVSTSIGVIGQA